MHRSAAREREENHCAIHPTHADLEINTIMFNGAYSQVSRYTSAPCPYMHEWKQGNFFLSES